MRAAGRIPVMIHEPGTHGLKNRRVHAGGGIIVEVYGTVFMHAKKV
jgi:hypothetical protein